MWHLTKFFFLGHRSEFYVEQNVHFLCNLYFTRRVSYSHSSFVIKGHFWGRILKHTKWQVNNFKLHSSQMFVTAVWVSFVLRLLQVVQAMADRNTYTRSTTIVFGFIRVASKWNCPLVRGIDKGFVKVAVTVTSSPTESWDTDAYMRRAKLSKCLKYGERRF